MISEACKLDIKILLLKSWSRVWLNIYICNILKELNSAIMSWSDCNLFLINPYPQWPVFILYQKECKMYFRLLSARPSFLLSSTHLDYGISILTVDWRHMVPSKNHYWYHCRNKPATTGWRGGLLPSLPKCMFKDTPLLILNICQMSHTLDYFLYTCIHNISNWKQHLSGFKLHTVV